MRLLLEINRTPTGGSKDSCAADGTDAWRPFSGVLELLKVLEETLDPIEVGAHHPPNEGTES